jgi:hypothetical protein
MTRVPVWAAVMLAVSACSTAPDTATLRLETAAAGSDTRLTLHHAPGYEINARVAPALTLDDGTVLRFGSPRLTADSSAFADPPTVLLAGRHDRIHGTLRASVCVTAERVCRGVTLRL